MVRINNEKLGYVGLPISTGSAKYPLVVRNKKDYLNF